MQPCLVPFLEIVNRRPSQPEPARKCAGALVVSPDFRMMYNHPYGVPAFTAGRFPAVGNYTTNRTSTQPDSKVWLFAIRSCVATM